VAICSSDESRIQRAAEELRAGGANVIARAADLRDAAACAELFAWATGELGGLDVLVNNTRGPILGRVEDLDDETWLDAFQLVLMSAVRLSRLALPALREGGHGAIVNLTSITAHQPIRNLVLSNALRPAVIAVGKTLSWEAAPAVRVNSILTGRFATDRILEENRHQASVLGIEVAEVAQRSVSNIPLGRLGRPDELAQAVVCLAGDCSSYITGATLGVDGGEYSGLF
jgi:3-oxoacyl-[acyl-carrier protein] reductase